jgi:PAS domain S-box-containing protein
MAWQLTVYAVPMAGAAFISMTLAVIAFRSRDQQTALPLFGVLAGAGIWCAATALQISSTTVAVKTLWHNVRFLGPTIVAPSIFLFAAEFTNRKQWLQPRRLGVIAVLELVVLVAVWTNPVHALLRVDTALTSATGFPMLDVAYGPLLWAQTAYHYVLVLAATYWFVGEFRRARGTSSEMYRTQAGLVLAATLIPWAGNIAFVGGLSEVDFTPIAFVATGFLFAAGLFHYRLLDLVPIAWGRVVRNMDSGVLVVDGDDVIVDLNPRAEEIIDTDRSTLVGTQVSRVFAQFPDTIRKFADARDIQDQVRIVSDGVEKHYDVDVTPLSDSLGRDLGRVIVFSDITDRVKREETLQSRTQELERQNERLEEFAGVVSHDLRNPINVAQGQLMLGLEQVDASAGAEHFELVDESLDRMEEIIVDVLSIARQGQTVTDREEIDLDGLCIDAWMNVETPDAALDVTAATTMAGDRQRLLQVFENLFRNSVEHGSTSSRPEAGDAVDHGGNDVTIRVGDLADGFYVEDDGPGIPEDSREKVFEKGYTTAEDGTGFGLSLVEAAIEAHGWTITVGESEHADNGGARFEITGITSSPLDKSASTPSDHPREQRPDSVTDD